MHTSFLDPNYVNYLLIDESFDIHIRFSCIDLKISKPEFLNRNEFLHGISILNWWSYPIFQIIFLTSFSILLS